MKNALLSILVLGIMTSTFAQNISMTEWRMHSGNEGIVPQVHSHHGDPVAYDIIDIPGQKDVGWVKAPVDDSGKISFGGNNASKLKTSKTQVDFTYFETVVDIPKNTSITDFKVSFDKVDDGARAYVFNSNHQTKGAFKGQIKLGESPVTEDYKEFLVTGKNRIVIVQFDDAGTGNNLHGAQVVVNGQALKVQVGPWRMHEGHEGIVAQLHSQHGDPIAYNIMNIPAENDSKWGPAPLDNNMSINYGGDNASKLKTTKTQVDFTYFDTFVTIPSGVVLKDFKVSFGKVDDGARAYVFNSKYKDKGAYKGQIKLGESPVTEDYKEFLVTGKNRIVIVQFDDAGKGNNLVDAKILLSY